MCAMSEGPGTKPNPDPTIATNEAVERAVKSERDYVDGQIAVVEERLRGIDRATQLLEKTADNMPDHISRVVAHLRDLVDERFEKIKLQFEERDTRSERESRDNKVAVDAAFAAQKEAAAKQDEGNLKAINKSEDATAETITKLSELFRTETRALSDKIDDLKERVAEIDKRANGYSQQRLGAKDDRTGLYAGIGTVSTLIFLAIAVVTIIATRGP
jgi:cation transport regulator ChaB